jgi:hypothetical protein
VTANSTKQPSTLDEGKSQEANSNGKQSPLVLTSDQMGKNRKRTSATEKASILLMSQNSKRMDLERTILSIIREEEFMLEQEHCIMTAQVRHFKEFVAAKAKTIRAW